MCWFIKINFLKVNKIEYYFCRKFWQAHCVKFSQEHIVVTSLWRYAKIQHAEAEQTLFFFRLMYSILYAKELPRESLSLSLPSSSPSTFFPSLPFPVIPFLFLSSLTPPSSSYPFFFFSSPFFLHLPSFSYLSSFSLCSPSIFPSFSPCSFPISFSSILLILWKVIHMFEAKW